MFKFNVSLIYLIIILLQPAYALITVIAGDKQVTKIGTDSEDVVFKVIDEQGNPNTEETVKFQLTNPFGNTVVLKGLTAYRAEPDDNGEVKTRLQSPEVTGNYIVIAKLETDANQVANAVVIVSSLDSEKPTDIVDKPIVDTESPIKLSLVSGNQQIVKAGFDSEDIAFEVVDEQGNPVTGEPVDFQLQDSTGNVTTQQNLTVYEFQSDDKGQVKTRLQNTGDIGNYIVVAKLRKYIVQSANANVVVTAGLVDIFKLVTGNNQTIATGETSANISFQLIDVFNNNIPEEVVTFQVIAPDGSMIDNGITTASSDINGIVITRLEPVSIKGNYTIKATAGDKTVQATIQVVMAIPILPSLGFGTTFDAQAEFIDSNDIFYGGIAVNDGDFSQETILNAGDYIVVKGFIHVAEKNIGNKADIILVASYELLSGEELFFMVGNGQNIQLWNGDLSTLIAYETVTSLEKTHLVSIYEGKLNDIGIWKVYFGYRLEDGTIVFNGNQSINCAVEE
ncbi:hypothetical protein QUF74_06090 [Candidatus Halobeggiatoa sp. HSG11]|nr:hypothetical protein [Candidatus Halobeggiatoa sp. HSG11]